MRLWPVELMVVRMGVLKGVLIGVIDKIEVLKGVLIGIVVR